jgi:hypothetical protein
MEIEAKAFKAAPPDEAGLIELTFATLGVVDRDGDIIEASAIPRGATVPIMQWGHNHGALPIGEATLDVDGDRAVARGRLYLATTAGREHYEVLRERGEAQEWSFGFLVTDAEDTTVDGRSVRVIRSAEILEVSPVLLGAGIGTRTDAIKSAGALADHVAAVQAAVGDVVHRLGSLAELRAKEGRTLSRANRELLQNLLATLAEAARQLDDLLAATAPSEETSGGGKAAVDAREVERAIASFAMARAATIWG